MTPRLPAEPRLGPRWSGRVGPPRRKAPVICLRLAWVRTLYLAVPVRQEGAAWRARQRGGLHCTVPCTECVLPCYVPSEYHLTAAYSATCPVFTASYYTAIAKHAYASCVCVCAYVHMYARGLANASFRGYRDGPGARLCARAIPGQPVPDASMDGQWTSNQMARSRCLTSSVHVRSM